jgi:hypothetical protein
MPACGIKGMAPTPFTSPPFATPSESMRPARTPAPILTFAQLQQDTKPHLAHPDRRRPNSHTSQHQHSTANHRATTTASGPPPPADSRSPPTSDTDVPELVGSRHTTADSATSGPDELMEEVQAPGGGPTGSVNGGLIPFWAPYALQDLVVSLMLDRWLSGLKPLWTTLSRKVPVGE